MINSNERIEKIWFTDGCIWVRTNNGLQVSQPLEVYPALFLASPEEREKYYIWANDTSVRWVELDEDIHISNFFQNDTVNYDNEVNHLLSRFPWLDMKAFAAYLDMHWTKLARFRYGVWTPTPETMQKIKNGIKAIANEMYSAVI